MSHAAGEKVPFTFADYLALPDDGKRYQVIEGELVEMNAPALRHQRILGELFVLLHGHVQQGPGGYASSSTRAASAPWTGDLRRIQIQ